MSRFRHCFDTNDPFTYVNMKIIYFNKAKRKRDTSKLSDRKAYARQKSTATSAATNYFGTS